MNARGKNRILAINILFLINLLLWNGFMNIHCPSALLDYDLKLKQKATRINDKFI